MVAISAIGVEEGKQVQRAKVLVKTAVGWILALLITACVKLSFMSAVDSFSVKWRILVKIKWDDICKMCATEPGI